MTTERPYLLLSRLRVVARGQAVYDQVFHEGVNIIRGQNGSGKSTIADFIFFALGGEFDSWKDAAGRCDEVQAEVQIGSTCLTLKRETSSKLSPISVFFGPMELAASSALERWERFPIRRQGSHDSFSQLIIRTLGFPEAQSEGASNITIHQILRLCYSDQRTPASRLFRYESFDTQGIREAVGDLVCGINGFESYEIGLKLRDLVGEVAELVTTLSALKKALPPDEALQTPDSLYERIKELHAQKETMERDVAEVDQNVKGDAIDEFRTEQNRARDQLVKLREGITSLEQSTRNIEYELREIAPFRHYLEDLSRKLRTAEKAAEIVGSIELSHCPLCGKPLEQHADNSSCNLCKMPLDRAPDESRYARIRFDIDVQLRETRQLEEAKKSELARAKGILRAQNRRYETNLSEFSLRYSGANGPRESYLAGRATQIGRIDAELTYLTNGLERTLELAKLQRRRTDLEYEISTLRDRSKALERATEDRRSKALGSVSERAVELLHSDLDRQEEFSKASSVELNFSNDAISVDGRMNFAESSNVFLKNAAILSMLLAAGKDGEFNHPRFLLLDNVEDKGMETERSHLFQRLIVERATELETPFQVIFTTSMMNPDLELNDYVIGPAYSKQERTLRFSVKNEQETEPSG